VIERLNTEMGIKILTCIVGLLTGIHEYQLENCAGNLLCCVFYVVDCLVNLCCVSKAGCQSNKILERKPDGWLSFHGLMLLIVV
jgi:hypothetical protein